MKRTLALAATLAVAATTHADVTLPKLLTDGAVLQQGKPVRLWGKAAPGEALTASLNGKTAKATASPEGTWQLYLPAQPAGGPYTLTIQGKNTVTLKNVLVGEVWVCSGQSNMEWPLASAFDAASEIQGSTDDGLRMFTVTKAVSSTPLDDVTGAWEAAAPSTSGRFSAVGYYFAKKLRKILGVPVGVIHTSWGGTRIEAWTSPAVNKQLGVADSEFAQPSADPAIKARIDALTARWKAAGSPGGPGTDTGIAALAKGWEATDLETSDWKTANAPGEWDTLGVEDLQQIDGVVWFRKTVEIPEAQAGKPMTLTLGAIDDTDITFVNGIKVGAMDSSVPNVWMEPRKYNVPAGLLKAGKNVIAVRIFDGQGGGGFMGPAEAMQLTGAGWSLPLAGAWQFKGERIVPVNPSSLLGQNPNAASALYNAMLLPVAPYTTTGAIWYQGESNAGNPMKYREQMPAMILDWRLTFQNPSLAFYMSQLAPFANDGVAKTSYAELREAQILTGTKLSRVGAAVITDVGEERDIHPKKKGPVGERLALLALRDVYGKKLVAQGPTFASATFTAGKVTVRMANTGGGLQIRGGMVSENPVPSDRLLGFEVAGADGKFVAAEAKITGKQTIEVSAPGVSEPKAVRYAFRNFPIVNLWNTDGLPAEPFRSDIPK